MDMLTRCMCLCILCLSVVEAVNGKEEDKSFIIDIRNDLTDREMILKLLHRVDDLEARNLRQEHRIEVMENELSDQKKMLTYQRMLYDKMNGKMSNQRQQMRMMRNSIKLLQRQNVLNLKSKSNEEYNDGEPITSNRKIMIRKADVDVDGIFVYPEIKTRRISGPDNEVTVAFFARLKVTMQHIGQNQNIVFEDVETNIGNAYNPHHGAFVAPVSGTYVFSASILADNNREVWCHYSVNGVVKAHIYARGTDNRHDQGSNTVILQLKQGDDVSVQNQAADDAVYGNGYSTLSGFLLQQDYSSQIVG